VDEAKYRKKERISTGLAKDREHKEEEAGMNLRLWDTAGTG
jgi:predicted GTPase